MSEVDLTREVWSEEAVMGLLGVKKVQLLNLRKEHGLPMRRLQVGVYVVLAGELWEWLKGREAVSRLELVCGGEGSEHDE